MSTATAEQRPMSTVRVELVVSRPEQCPVASISEECDGRVHNVARCCTESRETNVAEFTVTGENPPTDVEFEEVFTTETETRYRDCATDCEECVAAIPEAHDCPVTHIHAENGALHLTFYTPEVERVRRIVESLRAQYDDVSVARLTPSYETGDTDPVVIDANKLTERQREVLETAYRMGYFEHPKRANASDVADALDISPSTLAEHLGAAQQKLVGSLVRAQSSACD